MNVCTFSRLLLFLCFCISPLFADENSSDMTMRKRLQSATRQYAKPAAIVALVTGGSLGVLWQAYAKKTTSQQSSWKKEGQCSPTEIMQEHAAQARVAGAVQLQEQIEQLSAQQETAELQKKLHEAQDALQQAQKEIAIARAAEMERKKDARIKVFIDMACLLQDRQRSYAETVAVITTQLTRNGLEPLSKAECIDIVINKLYWTAEKDSATRATIDEHLQKVGQLALTDGEVADLRRNNPQWLAPRLTAC